MNDYGIPIIEPAVDYTKVPAIHQKRTITFINHFLIHTVTFLNKFSLYCEENLYNFENKLQKVEASLEILESRLSSIPEGDLPLKEEAQEENNDKSPIVEINEPELTAPSEEETKDEVQMVSKDPRYEKYFKMIQFGVPIESVKKKMQLDGLDPEILDNRVQTVPKNETADITADTNG